MSIYGTTLTFDDDDHEPGCARMREVSPNVYQQLGPSEAACTCGGSDRQPIVYEGSHLYPDPANRGGEFDLGVIPGHIAPGGGYDDAHEHWSVACHRPYLRMGMGQETIVLDEAQVRELVESLTDFLARITGDWCLKLEPPDIARQRMETWVEERKAEQ